MSVDEKTKQRLIEIAAGVYVERDVLNVVEKVKEYDPNLSIKYCEPYNALPTDAPYKLVERCRDGIERVVFDIWELNGSILDRLLDADTMKHNVFVDMEGHNLIVRERENQRYKETLELAHDVTVSMLKSPKHKWSYKDEITGNVTTFDDREKGPAQVKHA